MTSRKLDLSNLLRRALDMMFVIMDYTISPVREEGGVRKVTRR